jgi:hypothetical protein
MHRPNPTSSRAYNCLGLRVQDLISDCREVPSFPIPSDPDSTSTSYLRYNERIPEQQTDRFQFRSCPLGHVQSCTTQTSHSHSAAATKKDTHGYLETHAHMLCPTVLWLYVQISNFYNAGRHVIALVLVVLNNHLLTILLSCTAII